MKFRVLGPCPWNYTMALTFGPVEGFFWGGVLIQSRKSHPQCGALAIRLWLKGQPQWSSCPSDASDSVASLSKTNPTSWPRLHPYPHSGILADEVATLSLLAHVYWADSKALMRDRTVSMSLSQKGYSPRKQEPRVRAREQNPSE